MPPYEPPSPMFRLFVALRQCLSPVPLPTDARIPGTFSAHWRERAAIRPTVAGWRHSGIGVARNLCWGGWQPRRRRRRDRDAEGVEGGRVWGGGVKTSFGVFGAWKNTLDSHKSVIFDISVAYNYLVTFTNAKHKTFTYIFAPIAQLKRLCNFFTPFEGAYGRDSFSTIHRTQSIRIWKSPTRTRALCVAT